ncbi:MAG: hypothetical protein CSA58_07100 [Micrococcales bacterium]|nr:MAG: hypothetical protein CSA58_07100 [Micrococcales bacterium]
MSAVILLVAVLGGCGQARAAGYLLATALAAVSAAGAFGVFDANNLFLVRDRLRDATVTAVLAVSLAAMCALAPA